MTKAHWEEMFPDEFLAAREAFPVCYAPYGLAEPHGAYNAIGLDWIKAATLCEHAATAHGGIVAPPFCWHVSEMPRFDWPREQGVEQSLCSSLPGDLFLRTVMHQLRVFDARGFHASILVTGHYGGLEQDMRLVCEFYRRATGSPMQTACVADWELIRFEEYRGDHAGLCETQQLMALRPELVDLDRGGLAEQGDPWCGASFPGPEGRMPSAEIGRKIAASQVRQLGALARELLDAHRSSPGWRVPDQDRVDDTWASFERTARPYWVVSCSWDEFRRGGPPPFPGWDALGV